ncbi:tetratricopeptide repeat-containing sensor histidine kinase [Emticicia agri]|uniref:histidine kinase n=1 Tax=Emticicia agri TaxID=2492393 RepID=A0A4Q5M130_9BACT|nr:tetratricopeptide repeat protein [Emticicia agri]RYU95553.1 tetratricopeptide repeat protein [Emticicia agri]
MKNYLLPILFFLLVFDLSAQPQTRIDSLRLKIATQSNSVIADTTLVDIYNELGKEFIRIKNDSAIYYLQNALLVSMKANYKRGLLKTYIQLGRYYSAQFLPAKSIEYFFKAYVIAEQLKAANELRILELNIAGAYLKMQDYAKALSHYERYSALAKTAESPETYLLSLNAIAGVYFDKKDYKNALRYYQMCDTLNKKVNSPKVQTAALINTGKIQVELKNYDDALKRFKKAITIEDHYHDRIAFVGNEIARVYLLQNNPKEALKYALLAHNNMALTNAEMNGEVAKTLSDVYEKLGNEKLSYQYYKDYTKIRLREDSSKNAQILRLVRLDYENGKSNEKIDALNLDIKERQNNVEIMTGGIIALLLLIIIIAVYYQALSNKNKLIEKQKKDIEQLNESLEQKVEERTAELTVANKELKRKNNEIKEALLKGQTMERERVASELHDNIAGTLSALKWRFEALDRDNLSEQEKNIYDGILKNMHKAYGEVRLISHNMLPAEFEEQGLIGALEKFLTDLNITSSNQSKTPFSLDTSQLHKIIRQDVALELYICCFEAINNIIKHANATRVLLTIKEQKNGDLQVSIEDNGSGFSNSLNHTGKGIRNIKNRVERINAKLAISSEAGKGSKIIILVPESLWETYSTLTYNS